MNRLIASAAVESAPSSLQPSGPKRRLRIRNMLFVAFLVLLAGCVEPEPGTAVPRTLPCPSLTNTPWAEFTFGVDSPSDVVSTVVNLWGIEKDQIVEHSSAVDPGPILRWVTDVPGGLEDIFYVSFHRGQKLKKINIEWTWPNPTFAQIIDCLGFPDQYIAFYDIAGEMNLVNLALFYTDIGVVVRDRGVSWGSRPPANHSNVRIHEFVLVTPGTAEQMATDMYRYGKEPRHLIYSVCLLKPWPGSIEAIEIASDEEVDQCGIFRYWE